MRWQAATSLVVAWLLGCQPLAASNQNSSPPPPASQRNIADFIDSVRFAVVQIELNIPFTLPTTGAAPAPSPPPQGQAPIPQPIVDCFRRGHGHCLLGTGFFVDESGDVVTASHVATAIQQAIQVLDTHAIHTEIEIGVSVPNIETTQLVLVSGTREFPASIVAVDTEHDVALLHPTLNPFLAPPAVQIIGPKTHEDLPPRGASFVRLSVKRPRDGDTILVCGYPLESPGLVTTSGEIASAWKSEVLLTSQQNTNVDTYWIDVRVNPGNSGGPVFRMTDGVIIGMVVQIEGSLGKAVPTKYISDFLTANHIQWVSADTVEAPPSPKKNKKK